jgi:hypothetical protein
MSTPAPRRVADTGGRSRVRCILLLYGSAIQKNEESPATPKRRGALST